MWPPLTTAGGRKVYTNGHAQCTAPVVSPMTDRRWENAANAKFGSIKNAWKQVSLTDNWLCRQCAYKARQDAAQEEWAQKELDTMLKNSVENVSANRKISRKYHDHNKTVQELYAAIAKGYDKFDFPEAKSSIGCAKWEEYLEANQFERMNPCLGITSSCGTFEKRDFFVLIFPDAFTAAKQLICMVIHEMAHVENVAKAKNNLPGHGSEFQKLQGLS